MRHPRPTRKHEYEPDQKPQSDRATLRYPLRTVKEYSETVEYIHRNLVRRGLVARPQDWRWSSVHEYGPPGSVPPLGGSALRIDRVRIPADPKARI